MVLTLSCSWGKAIVKASVVLAIVLFLCSLFLSVFPYVFFFSTPFLARIIVFFYAAHFKQITDENQNSQIVFIYFFTVVLIE